MREWNTYVEQVVKKGLRGAGQCGTDRAGQRDAQGQTSAHQRGERERRTRIDTGSVEFNRVLGGGIVPGSMTLIGGEPGIGKSTLVMQIVLHITGRRTPYISGEESVKQLKLRAERLGNLQNKECYIVSETSLEQIFVHIKNVKPDIVIVDSIQTISTENMESSPGSISQVRECAAEILRYAKTSGVPVLLIGHINKEGNIAGPKVLEHIVDTVLQFEGDQHYLYRVLRSIKTDLAVPPNWAFLKWCRADCEVTNPRRC